MAFTAGSLADGQIAATKTTIYTCPGSTKAYIKSFSIFSTHASAQTIFVYIKRSGGTSRKLRRYVLEQNESAEVIESGASIELSTGDVIEAETTNATSVDYVITGVQEA